MPSQNEIWKNLCKMPSKKTVPRRNVPRQRKRNDNNIQQARGVPLFSILPYSENKHHCCQTIQDHRISDEHIRATLELLCNTSQSKNI